jgi:uncharacterized protein
VPVTLPKSSVNFNKTQKAGKPAFSVLRSNMQYIYTIKLIERLHDPKKWTSVDEVAVNKHFEYLKIQMHLGKMILAGRTQNDLKDTFGIVIFNAQDDDDAQSFMENDPSIQAGVMIGALYPYAIALSKFENI